MMCGLKKLGAKQTRIQEYDPNRRISVPLTKR